MAKETLEKRNIDYLLKAVSYLIRLPKNHIWLDYDPEADVLYLHFEKEPNSTHSEMQSNGIIFDYRDDNLVGITILEASHR
jgi:uncharacterized protein YuzE